MLDEHSQDRSGPPAGATILADLAFEAERRRQALIRVLVVVLIGAALNLMLYRLVIRPVSALSGIADRVSLGEFEAPEFAVKSNDEIGVLSESFNRMRTSLAHAMKMLDS